MKLFYSPNACSLAPHIVLREIGIPFELVKVDLQQHLTTSGEDFYQLNSKGQVPLLQLDDGQLLTEGAIISQFLVDQAKRGDLLPKINTLPGWIYWFRAYAFEVFNQFYAACCQPINGSGCNHGGN